MFAVLSMGFAAASMQSVSAVEPAVCEADAKDCVPDAVDPALCNGSKLPACQVKCNGTDVAACQSKKCTVSTANKCDFIASYINPFIKFLSAAVGVAVVVGILIGGMEYISSGSDSQKAANGRKHIRNAIIGLVSYILLFSLINFLIPGGI